MDSYPDKGVPVGDFLTACLANDFMEAVKRADDENIFLLPAYAAYIHWEIPAACHGSPKAVADWIEYKRKERELCYPQST